MFAAFYAAPCPPSEPVDNGHWPILTVGDCIMEPFAARRSGVQFQVLTSLGCTPILRALTVSAPGERAEKGIR